MCVCFTSTQSAHDHLTDEPGSVAASKSPKTWVRQDTIDLVAAVSHGKGLRFTGGSSSSRRGDLMSKSGSNMKSHPRAHPYNR